MKIFCIGRNYRAHAEELNNEIPTEPLIFMKPPSALLLHNKPFYYPEFSKDIHYELEIVIRMNKNGKGISVEKAREYYNKVALGIDFTARDLQQKCKEKGHPWEIAKAFDYSAVLSDFRPIDNFDREAIKFEMKKNEETVQLGDTSRMIFNFDLIISYISQRFKLQIGDLIYTGTPAGVGSVVRGDVLEGYLAGEQLVFCEIR